jgi:hypothetical protein
MGETWECGTWEMIVTRQNQSTRIKLCPRSNFYIKNATWIRLESYSRLRG